MAAGIGPADRSASTPITPGSKVGSSGAKGTLRLETGRSAEVVVISTPKAMGGAGAPAPTPALSTADSIRSFFSGFSLFSPRKDSTASASSPSLSSRVSTPGPLPLSPSFSPFVSPTPISPTPEDLALIQIDVRQLPSTQVNKEDYDAKLGEFFLVKGHQHVQPLEIDGITGTTPLLSDEKMIEQITKDLNRDASITLLGVALPTRTSNGGERLTKEQVSDSINEILSSQGIGLSPEVKTRLLNGMQQGILSPASIVCHAMLDENFAEIEEGGSSAKLIKDAQINLIAAAKGTEFVAELKMPTIRDTMKPFSIDVVRKGSELLIEAKKEATTTAKIDGKQIVFDYGVRVNVESGESSVFLKRTSD